MYLSSGFKGSSITSQLDIFTVMRQKLTNYAWTVFIWMSRIGGVWTLLGVLISIINNCNNGRRAFNLVRHVNIFYPMSALRQFISLFFCRENYVNEVIADRLHQRAQIDV